MNIANEKIAREVASKLLEIQAIKLNVDKPFSWSSGWKSPIYCDNRLSLSFPVVRSFIKGELIKIISEKHSSVEAIAGVATAGIPQGALIADGLELPFLYVRSSPKGHGMENLIEGRIVKGQKVVVVEDLISTGGSSLKVVEALRAAEFDVLGMVAIFTYGFKVAEENFSKANLSLICLSDYSTLLEEALTKSYINADQITSLEDWRKDPGNWRQ